MKEYFKNPETNKFFHLWLSNHPESYHFLDMERFYAFVLSLLKTSEDLTESILTSAVKEEKSWIDEEVDKFVNDFISRFYDLKQFWNYYKKN